MMIERQVSIALVGVAVAVVLPEYADMRHHPEYAPHAALLVGTLLGALGTLMGTLVFTDNDSLLFKLLMWCLWCLPSGFLSLTAVLGVLHSAGPVWQMVFAVSAPLPFGGAALVLVSMCKDFRRRQKT